MVALVCLATGLTMFVTAGLLRPVRAALPAAAVAVLLLTAALPTPARSASLDAALLVALPWSLLRVVHRRLPRLGLVAVGTGALTVLGALTPGVAGSAVRAVGVAAVTVLLLLIGADPRGDDDGGPEESQRIRALWVALGVGLAALAGTAAAQFVGGPTGIALAGVAALAVPVTVVLAARAPQVADVRRVIAAIVVNGVTALGVAAGISAGEALASAILDGPPGRGVRLLLVLCAAAGFAPLRRVLRPHVDVLLFGRHLDPLPVLVGLGGRLTDAGPGPTWLADLCRVAGLVSARLLDVDGVVLARHDPPVGADPPFEHPVPLLLEGARVGELVVGTTRPRPEPETRLVLTLLTPPLAQAVRNRRLAADLQRSRRRLSRAREDERRHLRHDLHDGLGPTLTGLRLSAQAAGRLLPDRTEEAQEVLRQLASDAKEALVEVRRIIDDLRPVALEEHGLAVAVQSLADRLADAGCVIEVDVEVPDLPPELEVTAYRVVAEALTNAARHAGATTVSVDVRVRAATLLAEVRDDGTPAAAWTAGVGLTSMAERTALLGGTLHAGPGPRGGVVRAEFPVSAEPALSPRPGP